jgi:HAD superfamily hydrolase (TIGR01662 family)
LSQRRTTAIIFDWGNTLCDYPLQSEPEQLTFLTDFLCDAVAAGNLPSERYFCAIDLTILQAINRERPDGYVVPFANRLRRELLADLTEVDVNALEAQLCTRIFATGRLREGAEAVLVALKASGYRTAILSNTPWGTSSRLWHEEVERYTSIYRLCDALVFCGDCGYRKPNPAAFIFCLSRLGVSPADAIMIGDNYDSDIIGAKRIGCRALWIGGRERSFAEAQPRAISTLLDVLRLLEDRNQIFWE